MMFALISQTPLVRPGELYLLSSVLELNANHCAVAWGRTPPAVVVIDDLAKLPSQAQPVVFVEDTSDPSALGIHHWDPVRGLAARVFVNNASGLNRGPQSIAEITGHEILEALVDPQTSLWLDYPAAAEGAAVQVALEVCDPVQDTYEVVSRGTAWQVANFVRPEWFDRRYANPKAMSMLTKSGGAFDHARRLSGPGEIGPSGYVVLRSPTAGGYEAFLCDRKLERPQLAAAKTHPWARTERRLG